MISNNIELTGLKTNSHGDITLNGSKSISNRVLIIRALCKHPFDIKNLSTSDDTVTLQSLLSSDETILDAHHAGTTFRFMTAYLATRPTHKTLTGSQRMQQRPIGPLVNALRSLGADIHYENNEGYPPLVINGKQLRGGEVSIDASISSQFLSALLLIAPTLEHGLKLSLMGELVSQSYLMMTLRIMEYFGISYAWQDNIITIEPQSYVAKDFYVEADWSAASYFYSVAALSDSSEITLRGLQKNSLQGDKAIADISKHFGVITEYHTDHIVLRKNITEDLPTVLEYNFMLCPDIAQTVSVMCAGLGIQMLFSGLQTLYIKETDRVAALQTELQKVGVFLSKLPSKFSAKTDVVYHIQEGKAAANGRPTFDTYNDHRMAMAFAPLAMLFDVEIADKLVVTKSYPSFWDDFLSLFNS